MTEYKAFSNTVVVFKEPTISQIVPKSGPNAGKETSVLEFKAYKPHFVKQKDGSFQQDKDGTEFFSVRYYGKESSAKRMAAGIKEGMMLEVRGDISTREFPGKNGKQMQENVLTAKGLAVSLNQPGLTIDYCRPKAKEPEAER